jgi:hypothetical protein
MGQLVQKLLFVFISLVILFAVASILSMNGEIVIPIAGVILLFATG